ENVEHPNSSGGSPPRRVPSDRPADTEALQLTCRRFHDTILANVDTLPTRLVCELAYGWPDRMYLYRAPTNNDGNRAWRDRGVPIAESSWAKKEILEMYETFGR
ncbi:hypothetical protein AAVH_37451, partial [Aphelenchoides avenae]